MCSNYYRDARRGVDCGVLRNGSSIVETQRSADFRGVLRVPLNKLGYSEEADDIVFGSKRGVRLESDK